MRTLPNYIKTFISEGRLTAEKFFNFSSDEQRDYTGFTFRFTQRFKTCEDHRFDSDLERMMAWAERNGASAMVIKEMEIPANGGYAKRRGDVIRSAIIGITDPICNLIENELKNC